MRDDTKNGCVADSLDRVSVHTQQRFWRRDFCDSATLGRAELESEASTYRIGFLPHFGTVRPLFCPIYCPTFCPISFVQRMSLAFESLSRYNNQIRMLFKFCTFVIFSGSKHLRSASDIFTSPGKKH